ncbi:MAG TPA: hypothetical protein PKD91_08765 [Bacteroidia bacterium]|nr:hypothetical protein [Bacteroidia bacterium]
MKKTAAFILFLLLSNLSFAQKFTTKPGGHCFTMEIPDYMAISYDLNDVAVLQYQNTAKEAYVITIDDSKGNLEFVGLKFADAKAFLDDFIVEYKKDADKRKQGNIKEFEANGNKHAQVELTWKDEDIDYFMLITTVETQTHFYKILCWTTKEYKEKLLPDFLTMASSLKD